MINKSQIQTSSRYANLLSQCKSPSCKSINGVLEAVHHGGTRWSASALQQACWGAPGGLRPGPSPCSSHGTPQTSQQPAFHVFPLISASLATDMFDARDDQRSCWFRPVCRGTRVATGSWSAGQVLPRSTGSRSLGANHLHRRCIDKEKKTEAFWTEWLVGVKNFLEHALVVRFQRRYTRKGNKWCLRCLDAEFVWLLSAVEEPDL